MSALSVIILGFLLGLRHALDADHVAAVSTMVAEERGIRHSSLIGLFWGMGHTATLFLVGIPVLLFHWVTPEWFSVLAEAGVGVMLLYLGGSLLFRMIRDRIHWHPHTHEGENHIHVHSHRSAPAHEHAHFRHFPIRSFTVGTVHGLAGSGALVLFVLGMLSSTLEGVLYLILYGVGVTIGMMFLTTAFSLPFLLKWGRGDALRNLLSIAAGAASLFIGLGLLVEGIASFQTLLT